MALLVTKYDLKIAIFINSCTKCFSFTIVQKKKYSTIYDT